MALVIGDNFSFQGAKPLDGRLKYDTLANMKAVGDSTMYDGCLAYCVATDKTYQWKSTNTVDTDLGKWREFSSGGGGGHAIEDSEGTALTQRDTMQFGDGFNATDDSENEKTVVEPNLMTAADMDDVVTPLPSVRSRYHKYSTEEQIVGEWIDGKPIYQKTLQSTIPTSINKSAFIDVASLNISKIITAYGYHESDTYIGFTPSGTDGGKACFVFYQKNNKRLYLYNDFSGYDGRTVYITIQYTKAD